MFSSSLNVLQTSLKLWALASFYYYKIVAFDHFSHSPLYNNRAQYLRRSAKDFSLWQVQLDRSTISYIERAKKQYNGISIHHNSDTDNSRQNIYVRFFFLKLKYFQSFICFAYLLYRCTASITCLFC